MTVNLDIPVRLATEDDAAGVAEIYNHYIAETVITFEEEPVSAAEMASRIRKLQEASLPWLCAEQGGRIVGYAYAGPWKPRSAYRYSVEVTVYVAAGHERRGIGAKLYERLFEILRERGIHAVMAGIALPNDGSVALHERFGLTKVAHFMEQGFKLGQWIDVGYWQRLL